MEKTRNGGGLIPGSVELENTMVKNEAEEEGNDEIVDNGVEHGSDYSDYGSMFFGGIYLSLFISLKFYIDWDASKLKTKKSKNYNKRKKGWKCGVHGTEDRYVRVDYGKCLRGLVCNRDNDRCITTRKSEENYKNNGWKVVGG